MASLAPTQGKFDEAKPLHDRSLQIYEKSFGEQHPLVARTIANQAIALSALGHHADACENMKRAVQIFEIVLGAAHPDTRKSQRLYADLSSRLNG